MNKKPMYERSCSWLLQVRELVMVKDFFFANVQTKVWKGQVEGVPITFLEPTSGAFWVGCIYGRNDDATRFGFFCGAALEYLKHHSDAMCAACASCLTTALFVA